MLFSSHKYKAGSVTPFRASFLNITNTPPLTGRLSHSRWLYSEKISTKGGLAEVPPPRGLSAGH